MGTEQLHELQERLQTELGRFLQGIQVRRSIDSEAFRVIDTDAHELARRLKGEALVPKWILNELRVATKVLRAEAPHIEGGRNPLVDMADRLEMTFDLILKGESHEDRIPGVPRIV